jgi:TetR/AcrR family transcriptional repressor of bet genes
LVVEPNKSRGRPSNTAARRGQIAAGLMKVMARKGFDGASVTDVARAAGLASGLVHYHFADKREILLELLGVLVERQTATLDRRAAESESDPARELDALIDALLALRRDADPDALACWVLLAGEALRDERVRAVYDEALAALATRFAACIRRGVARRAFRCASPKAAAGALVAAIQGYVVLSAAAPGVVPRGSAAASVRAMARGLLDPEVTT